MKAWYKKEGYLQFLLGNEWNISTTTKEHRNTGRVIVVATWIVYVGAAFHLTNIIRCFYRS